MSVYQHQLASLSSDTDVLEPLAGHTTLIVNVASKCGLTPQYEALESLHERFADSGFSVLGVPCNQFGAQEPGSPSEIAEFCSTTFGVTFPMSEKIDVNGPGRHPLYSELCAVADAEGHEGDIRWNFEKFLVGSDGEVIARYSPMIAPDDEKILDAITRALQT